ncbi:hypothetical protein IAR50_006979 [Cryptococcus sp. DSM 104548]
MNQDQDKHREAPTQKRPSKSNAHPATQPLPSSTDQTPIARQSSRTASPLPQASCHTPRPLDPGPLRRFYEYVPESRKTEGVPIDERLGKWGNVRLGELLEVEFPEPLSMRGPKTPYYRLIHSSLGKNSAHVVDNEANLIQ